MDKNQAREITISLGDTLKDAIITLTKAQLNDENVFIDFNGHKLYSADITIDGAYKEVLGMPREEYKKQREEEKKEIFKNKRKKYINKGKEYISEELWPEWEKCVNIRIDQNKSSVPFSFEIEDLLYILKHIKDGELKTKEAVEGFLDEVSKLGTSYEDVKDMLERFSEEYKKLPDENEK
jgi:hypothetical protein